MFRHLEGMLAEAFPREVVDAIMKRLGAEIGASSSQGELEVFWRALESHGENWGYQPSHPLARKIIATLVGVAFGQFPLEGLDHVREAAQKAREGRRVVLVGNHLSYGDVNYLQVLLHQNGVEDLPLLVMAGPKVYRDPFRRLSSMCFETIKMAQPPSRASDGADVSMRELVEITRIVMEDSEAWQKKGRVLYFFPEGSRSRSGKVERFISASARYCSGEDVWVYPVGFVGTENLMGVGGNEIRLDRAKISIGKGLSYQRWMEGVEGSPARIRKVWMDFLGFGVASLLPGPMRGVYGLEENIEDEELKLARALALTAFYPA